MEALAETIETALRSAQSRKRAALESRAERLLAGLAELRQRRASEHARRGEEPSVGSSLGPLGRSTIRTDVFAELQRAAEAAKPSAGLGARLEALERELKQALADFRATAPAGAFEDLAARGHRDSFTETLQRHEALQAPVVSLLGKARAAQLHLAALYRDDVHDRYFDAFGLDSLDEDERGFLAPLAFLAIGEPASDELPSIGHLVDAPLPVIVVRMGTTPSLGGARSPGLPLPYSALAFSPQWTWLQTTWDMQTPELPPLLAELLADFGRITGPAFIDVLGCDSDHQVALAEACGVWPAIAYFPGDGRGDANAARESVPIVRLSSAPAQPELSPASFAWELLGGSPVGSHFVELDEATRRSGGKPVAEYLALTREERQFHFPFFVADGRSRLVPPDVLRYCEQLSCVNRIWERLSRSLVEALPGPPQEARAKVARPEPAAKMPDDSLRVALERILNRLIDLD